MVADVFEQWIREADIDGFNMAYVSNPDSYETAVELLVPELQRRGLMWNDYTVLGGTFRENLYGIPGQTHLPDHHPGTKFKWNATEAYVNNDVRKDEHAGKNGIQSAEAVGASSMNGFVAGTAVTVS
ncbi:hypothetical protein V8E51_008789 [Hyaloscypha variabilis]